MYKVSVVSRHFNVFMYVVYPVFNSYLGYSIGVGTISPNHGRLSQMDPFDPKVNYLEGFLPTSNPQLTPALPTQPTYRLGYRLRGQSWRELGFRATGL